MGTLGWIVAFILAAFVSLMAALLVHPFIGGGIFIMYVFFLTLGYASEGNTDKECKK